MIAVRQIALNNNLRYRQGVCIVVRPGYKTLEAIELIVANEQLKYEW